MDPVTYLQQLSPFRELDPSSFAEVAAALEVVYVAAGSQVLHRGGTPSAHLHVVRKGTALLSRDGQPVLTVEPGEWFGLPSVLHDEPPEFDVEALEDLLLYRLPRSLVQQLASVPAFAEQISNSLAVRLRAASVSERLLGSVETLDALGLTPVGALVSRPVVTAPAGATVGEVARRMRSHAVTSVVLDSDPPAIVTDRDLRDRVLAEGAGPSVAARTIATSPVVAIDEASPAMDAQLAMLERAIHHLGVERDGRLVGVITTGDLLRHQAASPLHAQRELETLGREDLHRVPAQLRGVVVSLLGSGFGPLEVARTVSTLTDTLLRRAIELVTERHGPAPAPYAWLTLGSDARREQTLLTDQDHALVHGEVDAAGEAWFATLAADVTEQLDAAGIPPCPAGTTAVRWTGTLGWWRQRFLGWLAEPDARALLEAGIFFDHRVVAGHLDVSELDRIVRDHRHDAVLLARLASAAATARPPLGIFQRIRSGSDGSVDVKAGGLAPIVDLARLLAVEAGSSARSTTDRLAAAVEAGNLSLEGAEELTEAFAFLQRLRLEGQLAVQRDGGSPTNRVRVDELTPVRRRHLKEAFVAIARIQHVTVRRLSGEEVAR